MNTEYTSVCTAMTVPRGGNNSFGFGVLLDMHTRTHAQNYIYTCAREWEGGDN